MYRYRCTVCGYVYEPGVPFTDLPDNWVCPVCKAARDKFESVLEASEASEASETTKATVASAAAVTAPVTKRYTNGEITVLWQPAKCNHNGNCSRTLPQVFDPQVRPWVNIKGADSATIAKVVGECPFGALTVTWEKV